MKNFSFFFKIKVVLSFLISFFISQVCFAQIIYTDINPDTIIRCSDYWGNITPGVYNLDLDLNGTIDYKINVDGFEHTISGNQYWIEFKNTWYSKLYTAHEYVDTLIYGDVINDSLSFNTGTRFLLSHGSIAGTSGIWKINKDYYIGLRIGDFFGWVRCEIKCYLSTILRCVVKDYAYCTIPNQSLFAGEGIQNYGQNLRVSDNGDTKNGSDLKYEFDHAFDESGLTEYRIMVVNAEQTLSFNLDSANAVPAENYISIIPQGGSYSGTFLENSTSTDDLLITNLIPYHIFILSVTQLGGPNNILSPPSKEITLTSPAPKVNHLYAIDIDDYGDGRDLRVNFDKIDDESRISEYRIMIVPDTTSLNLELANNVLPNNYTVVFPSGSNYEVYLNEISTNINGDIITLEIIYRAYVLSIADGIFSDVNSLTLPSNRVILSIPSYLYAGQKDEEHIIYKDIIPDLLIYEDEAFWDVDEDGVTDLRFAGGCNTSPSGYTEAQYFEPLNNNEYYAYSSNICWVEKLDYLAPISPTDGWIVGNGCLNDYNSYTIAPPDGLWNDQDGYLGFRIIRESDTLIGWFHISVPSCGVVMKEYAYMHYSNHIKADFSYTKQEYQVFFANHSVNLNQYQWFFGDGDTSNEKDPIHIYQGEDDYIVTLIASGALGSDTVSEMIHVCEMATADFTYEQDN
ncbi:MAG: PKD domain-containing protein, partial [Bacteroidales bacterium]|nr:PKD domain-containing protein [Bacteroidales bacterium]